MQSRRTIVILAISLLTQLALISPTKWAGPNDVVRYTDIDYSVFSGGLDNDIDEAYGDGGNFMTEPTPYRRVSYRYTPFMSYFLVANKYIGVSGGKITFAIGNVIAAGISSALVRSYSLSDSAQLVIDCMLAFNPIIMHVGTRGNADIMIALCVLISLYALRYKYHMISAAILGVGIHLKMYPIFMLPVIVLAMNLDSHPLNVLRKCNYNPIHYVYRQILSVQPIQYAYVLITLGVAGCMTYYVQLKYGYTGLYEAFIYHFERHDHRHNMALLSTWNTLLTKERNGMPIMTASWIKAIGLLGNKLTPMLIGCCVVRYNLYQALAVQIILFVAFNGVFTVQYCVWFLTLIPLAIASSSGFRRNVTGVSLRFILLLVIYLVNNLFWVYYSNEFEGKGNLGAFYYMMFTNVMMFISLIACGGMLMGLKD